MVIRPHPFRRLSNKLLIYLDFADWPADLPLLSGTQPWHCGDGQNLPYWSFILEPERTIEQIIGIFGVPGPVTEALAWYQTELPLLGWEIEKLTINLETNSWLKYRLAENEAIKLRLNLRDVPGLQLTWLIIQRIVIEPYPLRESETTEITHE